MLVCLVALQYLSRWLAHGVDRRNRGDHARWITVDGREAGQHSHPGKREYAKHSDRGGRSAIVLERADSVSSLQHDVYRGYSTPGWRRPTGGTRYLRQSHRVARTWTVRERR